VPIALKQPVLLDIWHRLSFSSALKIKLKTLLSILQIS
jgi:hypothetical protein